MSYHHHPRFTPPSSKVVAPLSKKRRSFLFWSLLVLFVVAVPIFVFYATGYRYDVFAPDATITATGGLYISVSTDEGEVFLNNERVEDSRIFRSALYIQNIMPGLQRVHVQAPGYHTWVKELPVYPHIVTEASTFLLPIIPQVRPITQYVTATGTPIYLGIATTTRLFSFASTTVPFMATSSRATTTLRSNDEFTYVSGLFATTTATTTTPFISRVVDEARGIFEPGEAATTSTSTEEVVVATTTITEREVTVFERGDDIVVRFLGSERTIPYYFCIPDDIATSTSERYEAQVIAARQALAEEIELRNDIETTTTAERQCRREIIIDRQGQKIVSFAFFPGSTDLIVLHRQDGIFVTEIDDRAWQNTQQLYPASAEAMVIDGGRIYVRDGGRYLEILTELPTT